MIYFLILHVWMVCLLFKNIRTRDNNETIWYGVVRWKNRVVKKKTKEKKQRKRDRRRMTKKARGWKKRKEKYKREGYRRRTVWKQANQKVLMGSSVWSILSTSTYHRQYHSPLLWPKGVQNLVAGAGLMLCGLTGRTVQGCMYKGNGRPAAG